MADYQKKILFSPVKLLFIVCFILSQSKDIFSYLKTTVYSCYSCSRQEGAQFFSSSQLSTQANIRFPLKYTVSLVSVFLVDNPIIYLFSTVKLLFTVCFILSQSKNILSRLSQYFWQNSQKCFSLGKTTVYSVFHSVTVKNIFSHLKTTVYSCYSCSRQRRGSIFSDVDRKWVPLILLPLFVTAF